MSETEFNDWLDCLNQAERWLRAAFDLMDASEGYTATGERAHLMALSAIQNVRGSELACRAVAR